MRAGGPAGREWGRADAGSPRLAATSWPEGLLRWAMAVKARIAQAAEKTDGNHGQRKKQVAPHREYHWGCSRRRRQPRRKACGGSGAWTLSLPMTSSPLN